ncbi:hypothetical protein PLICRDRAFT_199275 [Plicaturopsis crispa FD-325 SS-3]|nr:hypothetical protein PLICRDRAFT_199275 [Plicaturopsis crispa FD-325 SS-3]
MSSAIRHRTRRHESEMTFSRSMCMHELMTRSIINALQATYCSRPSSESNICFRRKICLTYRVHMCGRRVLYCYKTWTALVSVLRSVNEFQLQPTAH